MAGVKMHLVTPDESQHWAQMLRDRNLTSHTYNERIADELVERLLRDYAPCFRTALTRLRASAAPASSS